MFPVWLMRGRVIIGISSPKGKTNHFSKLFFAEYPDTHEPIFNTYVHEGRCKKCREAGRKTPCNHEPWRYPSWLSVGTKMQAIQNALADDAETFAREQGGIMTEDSSGAYIPYKYIDRMKSAPRYKWQGQDPPAWVVIACDPNAGGSSDTAFVAMCVIRGTVVTLGLDAYPCKDTKQMVTFYRYFIEKLYNHPWLKNAIFVIFVERNLASGPYALETVMESKYHRHYIISDPVRDVSGWFTGRDRKTEYVVSGSDQVKEDKIVFLEDLVCMNPWLSADKRTELTINKVLEQLPRFRMKEVADGHKKLPVISGRIDENGKWIKGAQDDLAFTFFMCLFMLENINKEEIPGLNYSYIKQINY